MTKLLEKDAKFDWSQQCDEAFLTLNKFLTTAPVLAQPNLARSEYEATKVAIVPHGLWSWAESG
jgi:hypothetical protein